LLQVVILSAILSPFKSYPDKEPSELKANLCLTESRLQRPSPALSAIEHIGKEVSDKSKSNSKTPPNLHHPSPLSSEYMGITKNCFEDNDNVFNVSDS
jgi:hypothetical protein